MGLFDLILNRNKKSFKSIKKKKNRKISTADLQKLLEDSNDPVVEMFKQIERYKSLKKDLLQQNNIEDLGIPQSEILSIIDKYLIETLEQIPSGIVIPIKTNFKINGREQALLIGKDLMCVGKFYINNGEKLKRGIKKQDKLALFVDSTNIDNYTDFNKNIRIEVNGDTDIFTNLITDTFLEDNWSVCRFSTVEITFNQGHNHTPLTQLTNSEVAINLFKYLPDLEVEMTNSITTFLREKAQYFSETLKMNTQSNTNQGNNSDKTNEEINDVPDKDVD